jgi:hypothetical protein
MIEVANPKFRLSKLVATALLTILAACAFGNVADSQPERGIFATLKPDQQIVLKEVGDKYEINVLELGSRLSHVVIEVGSNHVVVRDSFGLIETRIPVYSIKAIVTIKNLKK